MKCRIKRHNGIRAATKAAIAAADLTGMTNPRTGRPYNIVRKKAKRTEVFDPQFLAQEFTLDDTNKMSQFEESPALLIGKLEVDSERDTSAKIAAFDMDWTLIETKDEV